MAIEMHELQKRTTEAASGLASLNRQITQLSTDMAAKTDVPADVKAAFESLKTDAAAMTPKLPVVAGGGGRGGGGGRRARRPGPQRRRQDRPGQERHVGRHVADLDDDEGLRRREGRGAEDAVGRERAVREGGGRQHVARDSTASSWTRRSRSTPACRRRRTELFIEGSCSRSPRRRWSPNETGAQQEPPRFRGGVEIIQLDAAVLDRNRKPVTGLTAADFTVLEDGKPQPIVAFQELTAPDPDGSLVPWMRDVAPDVQTNSRRRTPDLRARARRCVDRGRHRTSCQIVDTVRKIARAFHRAHGPARSGLRRLHRRQPASPRSSRAIGGRCCRSSSGSMEPRFRRTCADSTRPASWPRPRTRSSMSRIAGRR